LPSKSLYWRKDRRKKRIGGEGVEEDLSSYWMTLRIREDAGN
jgi:hypothetical protein